MPSEREPNRAIREYVESGGPQEWAYKNTVQTLYEWSDVFRFYFFGAQDEAQPGLPQPLIAVAPPRADTLAAYRPVPNPSGLPYEITMNTRYLDRPGWGVLETLLHDSSPSARRSASTHALARVPTIDLPTASLSGSWRATASRSRPMPGEVSRTSREPHEGLVGRRSRQGKRQVHLDPLRERLLHP